jgi:hypothetical protein
MQASLVFRVGAKVEDESPLPFPAGNPHPERRSPHDSCQTTRGFVGRDQEDAAGKLLGAAKEILTLLCDANLRALGS